VLAACGTTVSASQALSAGSAAGTGQEAGTSQALAGSDNLSAPGNDAGTSVGAQDAPGALDSSAAVGQAGPSFAGGGSVGTATTADGQAATVGSGFTRQQVFFGLNTVNDANSASSYGFKAVSTGDTKAMAEAVVAEINREGGVLGRRVVGIYHDEHIADIFSNPAQNSQSTCAAFTQDHRVAMAFVIDPLGDDTDVFYQCMSKGKTPFITAGAYPQTRSSLQRFAPYVHVLQPVFDSFAPTFVTRLKAMGYFAGWDTLNGAAGPGPAKIGLLHVNIPGSQTAFATLAAALKKEGSSDVTEASYADPTTQGTGQAVAEAGQAALRFKTLGITHVITDTEGALAAFANAAQSQQYHPRYGVHSALGLHTAQANAPAAQFVGALGVGYVPASDVATATGTPAANRCLDIMRRAGVSVSAQDASLGAALAVCDYLRLFVAAARAGGGLDAQHLTAGLAKAGSQVPSAFTFQGALSETRPDNIGAVRDVAYEAGCSCFAYRSKALYGLK
jgi:hypothetical protein